MRGPARSRSRVPRDRTVYRYRRRRGGDDAATAATAAADLAELLLDRSSGTRAVSFSRVKVSRSVPFLSLREALSLPDDQAPFTDSDLDKSFDLRRRSRIMGCFRALDTFVGEAKRLPRKRSGGTGRRNDHDDDVERFRRLVRSARSGAKNGDDKDRADDDDDDGSDVTRSFARTCRAGLAPVQALAGALGAHYQA